MSQSPLLQWRGATEMVPSTALVASSTTLRGAQKTSLLTAILNATSFSLVKTNNDATNFALQQYKQNAARISVQQQQEWQEQIEKDTLAIEEANEYVQDMVALASDIMTQYNGEITENQMITKLNSFVRETKRQYAHINQKTALLQTIHAFTTGLIAMVMVFVNNVEIEMLEDLYNNLALEVTKNWGTNMFTMAGIGAAVTAGLKKWGPTGAVAWFTAPLISTASQSSLESVTAIKFSNLVTYWEQICNYVKNNLRAGTMVIGAFFIVLSVFVRVVLMIYYGSIAPTRKSCMDKLRKELLNLRSAAKQVPRLENDLFPHVEAVVRAACM